MFSGSKVITISSLLVALVLQCYNAAIRNCGENIIQRKCFEDTTEDVHIEFTVNCLDATFNFTLKAGSDKKYFQVDYNCRNASTRISVSGYPQTLIYLPILDDGDEVDRQSVQLREVFDKENDIICTLESCMEFELKMNTCWKSVKEIRVCPSSDSTANTTSTEKPNVTVPSSMISTVRIKPSTSHTNPGNRTSTSSMAIIYFTSSHSASMHGSSNPSDDSNGLATPLLAILSVVMLLGALALVAISLAYIRQPRFKKIEEANFMNITKDDTHSIADSIVTVVQSLNFTGDTEP